MAKMFAEYDAVRIDHPQGLVCPWVYRADDPDPLRAVQRGARLFSSPRVAEHPALARYAIAEPDQLAPGDATPRFADDWVAALRPEQVDRYAVLFDRVVEEAGGAAEAGAKLVCEVLSTLPHPLARVLERHGLGRFRVTQKVDPTAPRDVYRAENAAPQDWIMFGNHDTPPLWRLLGAWRADGRLGLRADLAAARLAPAGADREAFRAALTDRPELLGQAEIAQLFASPAENVSVFFADFFGLEEVYNRPGTLDADNWTLRLPPDWREAYATRLRDDRALNLPLALYWALRARPGAGSPEFLVALRREAEAVRAAPALP